MYEPNKKDVGQKLKVVFSTWLLVPKQEDFSHEADGSISKESTGFFSESLLPLIQCLNLYHLCRTTLARGKRQMCYCLLWIRRGMVGTASITLVASHLSILLTSIFRAYRWTHQCQFVAAYISRNFIMINV